MQQTTTRTRTNTTVVDSTIETQTKTEVPWMMLLLGTIGIGGAVWLAQPPEESPPEIKQFFPEWMTNPQIKHIKDNKYALSFIHKKYSDHPFHFDFWLLPEGVKWYGFEPPYNEQNLASLFTGWVKQEGLDIARSVFSFKEVIEHKAEIFKQSLDNKYNSST